MERDGARRTEYVRRYDLCDSFPMNLSSYFFSYLILLLDFSRVSNSVDYACA